MLVTASHNAQRHAFFFYTLVVVIMMTFSTKRTRTRSDKSHCKSIPLTYPHLLLTKSIISKGPAGGNLIVYQCRHCRKYQHTDKYFCHHEAESPSLLALCLRSTPALSSTHSHRNNGLSNVKLVDSM